MIYRKASLPKTDGFGYRRLAFALALGTALGIMGCTHTSAPGPDVWAEADGKPITRAEVERQYRNRIGAAAEGGDSQQDWSFKLNILDELINNQILLSHAAHAKVTVSEAEVDDRIAQLRTPYSEEEFQKKLSDQGATMGQLRTDVRNSLIITKLINKEIESRIEVSDAEIRAFYDRNKANFSVPETQYHVAQIEVTPAHDPQTRNLKNDDATSPVAAERKIQALYARLHSGEDFSTVAQEYSEDPRSAPGGGDMGFLPASSLDSNPPLKKVILSLQVGGISNIIQTATGSHIIKLLGIEKAGQHDLSEPQIESSIRQTLTNEKEQLLKAAYIEDLRNRAKIVNYLAQRISEAGGPPPESK
ncbi:MAG: peptidylprolyl isomerase [Deltaproteobacteria bacterium]